MQGCGFDAFDGGVHGDDGAFAHRMVGDSALVRGFRVVMFLDDFGPVALLGNQFLPGQQIVGEDPILLPDLVEELQFGGCVIAQVADQSPDPAQFFCSTCAPSFLLPGRDRVNVIWCSSQ